NCSVEAGDDGFAFGGSSCFQKAFDERNSHIVIEGVFDEFARKLFVGGGFRRRGFRFFRFRSVGGFFVAVGGRFSCHGVNQFSLFAHEVGKLGCFGFFRCEVGLEFLVKRAVHSSGLVVSRKHGAGGHASVVEGSHRELGKRFGHRFGGDDSDGGSDFHQFACGKVPAVAFCAD